MIQLEITGRVLETESGRPLEGLYVKAHDADLLFDDLLGSAFSGPEGGFRIVTRAEDYREFFDRRPDVYVSVYGPDGRKILHRGEELRWNVSRDQFFDIRIPRQALSGISVAAPPALVLAGDAGEARTDFDVGESLFAAATGLRPATPYHVELRDEDGTAIFTQTVMTDAGGTLPETVLWPQMGLDDLRSGEPLSLDEARRRWSGRTLRLLLGDGERAFAEAAVRFAERFERPLLFAADERGTVLNGFVAGERDAALALHNLPWSGEVQVYLVPRMHDWREGDPFAPVTLEGGRPAVAEARAERGGSLTVRVAAAGELAPGAYDFIVRPVRYGYEEDERWVIGRRDLVGHRRMTGLVVREEFMASKFVRGGCANLQRISGRTIAGQPYFQFADVFQKGEDIYGALDPNALDPNHQGRMVALYVVQHKTAVQWNLDPTLTHLPQLGGNANAPRFLTQTGCINANKRLLWAAAPDVGDYDIVADFGNDSADAATFVPDHTFHQPQDFVDGYVVPGFKVVEDPAVFTRFGFAGTFDYNDGNITVTDNGRFDDPYLPFVYPPGAPATVSANLDAKARVFFPADAPGATTAAQISAAQPTYPIFVAVHGNSSVIDSYLGYDYLLEHMARNGFIAASIHMPGGMKGRGRAEVLLDHLTRIKTRFGAKAANNIGVMGHSRGGEGVVMAPRIAQQTGSPHAINAVIALAPTDQYGRETLGGAWATPLMVIYGSMDGDVSGERLNNPAILVEPATNPQRTGFSIYDRADGEPKSMHFVYGATHNRFNTLWGTDGLPAADVPKRIDASAHQAIARGYMTAFMRRHLLGEAEMEGVIRGEWIPAAIAVADPDTRIYTQFHDVAGNRLDVDTFEGAHTPTSWGTSTLNQPVAHDATLPAEPAENALVLVDNNSPHDTAGALLRWDGTGDRLRFALGGATDVAGFAALAIRIAQRTGSADNTAGAAQDLYVTLKDQGGISRDIKVSKFIEIPPPHERSAAALTKSAMNTIRIPLHAYTIKAAGMQSVNLQQVVEVALTFAAKPKGEIEIDTLQFTQ